MTCGQELRINTANFVGQEVTSSLDASVNSSAGPQSFHQKAGKCQG